MDRSDRARIDSLLAMIRSWPGGLQLQTAEDLAQSFQLDPFIVRRLLETEGLPQRPERRPRRADGRRKTVGLG